MNDKKVLELIRKLKDYNIHFIDYDELGFVNIDNLEVSEEYLFDVLEDFK